MPAGYLNLKIESGSTYSVDLELTNDDGSYIDLTNCTAACKMRKSYYSNFGVYNLVVTIGNPPTDGKITISADATYTSSIKPGRYVYDVELYNSSVVSRIIEGIIEVSPNATK